MSKSCPLGIPNICWPVVTGDDEQLAVIFDGLPYDSGRTWTAQARQRRTVTAPIVANIAASASQDGSGNQVVLLELTAAQTRAMGGSIPFDLQCEESGITTTLAIGSIDANQDVTL